MKNYYFFMMLFILTLNVSALQAQYLKGYGVYIDTQCDPDGKGVTLCQPVPDPTNMCDLSYKLVHPNGDTSEIEGIIKNGEICYHLDYIPQIGEYRILTDYAGNCGQNSPNIPNDVYFFWSGCIDAICGEYFYSGNSFPIGPQKVFKIPANAKQVVCGIQNTEGFSDTLSMFIDGVKVASLAFCEKENDGGLCGPLEYNNGVITQFDPLDFPYYDSLGVSGDRPYGTGLFIMEIPPGSCNVELRLRTKKQAPYSQYQLFTRCLEYETLDTISLFGCDLVEFDGVEYTSDTLIFTKLWEDQSGCTKSVYHKISIGSTDVYKDVYVCPGDQFDGVTIESDTVLVKTVSSNGCTHNEITQIHALFKSNLTATIYPGSGTTIVEIFTLSKDGAQIFLDGASVLTVKLVGAYPVFHTNGNHTVRVSDIADQCGESISSYFIQTNGGIIIPSSPDEGNFIPPSNDRLIRKVKKGMYDSSGNEISGNQSFLIPGMYYIIDDHGTITKTVVH